MDINKKKIESYKKQILEITEYDHLHKNSPELQIETLSYMVGGLLENNKNGENDMLIAFLTHIGRSLKELIKYKSLNKEHNGKY